MGPRVFLITGTSTGFGNELAKTVLQNGDQVVATSRDSSPLGFSQATESNSLLLDLDVTDQKSVDNAFAQALQKFGRVDVVVNNAGFGLGGVFEAFSESEIRKQFEVNFFGVLKVTKKAMETMREQRPPGGVVQQITSIGGQIGVPLFSIYNASKWAVEGFTEAVAAEVKPQWGIKFTCIEPGGFKTEFAGRSVAHGETKHPAYGHWDVQELVKGMSWPGDPVKAAKVFYDLAVMEDPPLRCVVGTDAYGVINKKLEEYTANVKRFEQLSKSTDADE